MRRALVPVILLSVAALPVLAAPPTTTTTAPMEPAMAAYTPTEMQWADAPPNLPPGAKLAVLEGNPSQKGHFAIRLRVPDGYRVPPHWHPTRERVTVISGMLNFGMGDQFDAAKGKAMPAGSYGYVDGKMHHYAWATGATEIQVDGVGPFAFNYVNAADDPAKKK